MIRNGEIMYDFSSFFQNGRAGLILFLFLLELRTFFFFSNISFLIGAIDTRYLAMLDLISSSFA